MHVTVHQIQVANDLLRAAMTKKHFPFRGLDQNAAGTPYIRSLLTDSADPISTQWIPTLFRILPDMGSWDGSQTEAQRRNFHARRAEAVVKSRPGLGSDDDKDDTNQSQADPHAREGDRSHRAELKDQGNRKERCPQLGSVYLLGQPVLCGKRRTSL